ncbi:MAG: LPS assembly lipoprotein LptE [Planctomycetota bacterium]|nr:LPS assembly lipoprotein LptE [Planctomycetota bacterium]
MRALLIASAACLSGCGYSTGLHLAPEYASIGVDVFGNDSPVRDVERDLHMALTKVARDRVQARLAAPGAADVVIQGTVLHVLNRGGIRTTGNVQVESGLTVTAQASLWDPRSEEVVAGPVQATTHVGYALDDPFAEERALRRALEHLAERLLFDLLADPAVDDHSRGPSGPSKQ